MFENTIIPHFKIAVDKDQRGLHCAIQDVRTGTIVATGTPGEGLTYHVAKNDQLEAEVTAAAAAWFNRLQTGDVA